MLNGKWGRDPHFNLLEQSPYELPQHQTPMHTRREACASTFKEVKGSQASGQRHWGCLIIRTEGTDVVHRRAYREHAVK